MTKKRKPRGPYKGEEDYARDSLAQINIRLPREEAKDWRGLVLTLRAMGRYISLTSLIRDAVNKRVEDYAEEGIQWRATPAGKLPRGCDKSSFIQETTNENR